MASSAIGDIPSCSGCQSPIALTFKSPGYKQWMILTRKEGLLVSVEWRCNHCDAPFRTLRSISSPYSSNKLEISQHRGKEGRGELGTQSYKAVFSYVALVGKRFKFKLEPRNSLHAFGNWRAFD